MGARPCTTICASVVALAGCYQQAFEPCTTRCTAEDQRCPDGQTCGSDLRCYATNGAICTDAGPPCYGHGLENFGPYCPMMDSVPSTASLPGGTLDTDTCALVFNNACLVIAQALEVPADVQVTGSRPLVLIGTSTLAVHATIDLRSGVTLRGAGRNHAGCLVPPIPTGEFHGRTGGIGGAYGDHGGAGGLSLLDFAGSAGASGVERPTDLRGGCPGSSGRSDGMDLLDTAGDSGGAIYLIAGDTLTIDAQINAGGAGGRVHDTATGSGGGGGGSGGTIAIEAASFAIAGTARLCALGGGGASGANDTGSGGSAGADSGLDCAVAVGGATAPGTFGGGGGLGGTGPDTGKPGVSPDAAGDDGGSAQGVIPGKAGGGGGGGSVGFVLAFSPNPVSLPDHVAQPAAKIVSR